MSELFLKLLQKRGVDEDFLHPKYEQLADPFCLNDMDKAVERLKKAVEKGEKVLIYGDYDVDGVTASTAMYDVLGLAGLKGVEVMLPNRFRDGYGMSEKVIERAIEGGFALVVTVDCGSRNHEIIEKLAENRVEVIVTDHHECAATLPAAVAVINPKITGVEKSQGAELCSEKGLQDLAGVGVVFELARALVAAGLIANGQEKWLLDLVLIGTICDSMRLSRENRILTYFGMKVLAKTRRPGLKELMRVAKVEKINAEAIGFRIGPRLNAAGRIESAEKALRLLMTKDKSEAASLALELNELNTQRREFQEKAMAEIEEKGVGEEPVIVVTGDWPEGVLGIIAGKLVEKYVRPAFVLTEAGEMWKGSGRSFGDFNLAKGLDACSDCTLGGGGHAEACGLKVKLNEIERFRKKINEYYRGLNLQKQGDLLQERADLATADLAEMNLDLMEELLELEPFGEGNHEPIFELKNLSVIEVRRMGKEKQHLSMIARGRDGGEMRLIAWSAPQEWLNIGPDEKIDAKVRLVENEFRGLRKVEARLIRLDIVQTID